MKQEMTERIIAAAIRVHRELGPGFLESIYEQALAVEFALNGIQFVRQKAIALFYKDHQIGEHRLDFLIEDIVVVELKAISALEDIHFAIGRGYKTPNLEDDLLPNFANYRSRSNGSAASARWPTPFLICLHNFHFCLLS